MKAANTNLRRSRPLLCGMAIVLLAAGCSGPDRPRLRVGAFFGSPMGMTFPDPNHLGHHRYTHPVDEKLGMVYTCRGGFIDVGHVREAADRTAYLAGVVFRNLMLDHTEFTFRVIEPSRYKVILTYPDDWEDRDLEQREAVAGEMSVLLGQYFARTSLVWHEIVTWYGFSSMGIFPEKISSFSCEDGYSDLLGTRLAVQALQNNGSDYDASMTRLLGEALQELGVQPPQTARRALKQIEGSWYTGGYYFFVDIKKRNFDMGFTDGQITPFLVPEICPSAEPQSLPVPDTAFLDDYGFTMDLIMQPRVLEQSKIYRDLGLDDMRARLVPALDFPELVKQIRKQGEASDDDAS